MTWRENEELDQFALKPLGNSGWQDVTTPGKDQETGLNFCPLVKCALPTLMPRPDLLHLLSGHPNFSSSLPTIPGFTGLSCFEPPKDPGPG